MRSEGPVRVVSCQSGTSSLKFNSRDQLSRIQESFLDQRNVVVITFCGDLKKEKAFLINCLVLWLDYTYPSEDVEQVIGDWRKNPPPELLKTLFFSPSSKPGMHLCPKLWLAKNRNEKFGILLMDCSADASDSYKELSLLGAVCTQISSVLVYVAKNKLDCEVDSKFQQFVNVAAAVSTVGALEEKKMFQKVMFVVTDSMAEWGESVGQKQLERFLSTTCEDSKVLYKDFHFARLFDAIECVYMPKSGVEHLLEEIEFYKLINVVSEDFKTAVGILAHRLVGPNSICSKSCKPTELLNYLLPGIVKGVNAFTLLRESRLKSPLVHAKAWKIIEDEKILIAASKIYRERMSQYLVENPGFREWNELALRHGDFVSASLECLKIRTSADFDKARYDTLGERLTSRLKMNFSEIEKLNRAQEDYFRDLKGVCGVVALCITVGLLLTAISYTAEEFLVNPFMALILSFIGKTLLLSGLSYVLLVRLF